MPLTKTWGPNLSDLVILKTAHKALKHRNLKCLCQKYAIPWHDFCAKWPHYTDMLGIIKHVLELGNSLGASDKSNEPIQKLTKPNQNIAKTYILTNLWPIQAVEFNSCLRQVNWTNPKPKIKPKPRFWLCFWCGFG